MPSTTKLAHRLTGTIERPESTETPDKYPATSADTPTPHSDRHHPPKATWRHIFTHHGGAPPLEN